MEEVRYPTIDELMAFIQGLNVLDGGDPAERGIVKHPNRLRDKCLKAQGQEEYLDLVYEASAWSFCTETRAQLVFLVQAFGMLHNQVKKLEERVHELTHRECNPSQ